MCVDDPVEPDDDLDIPAEVREELWAKADALAKLATPATKQLLRSNGRRLPDPMGCSVLLRVADSFFLLTARHVVDKFASGEPILFPSGVEFVSFTGRIHRTQPNAQGKDALDAAVLDIDVERVSAEMRDTAVPVSWLESTDGRFTDIFQLIGYPANRFGKVEGRSVRGDWFQWTGTAQTAEELLANGHEPGKHVAFDFEPQLAQDEHGELKAGPSMPGVSGAGMWTLPPMGAQTINGRPGILTAIFTDQLPLKRPTYMLGTLVSAHIGIILRHRPDLARHILGAVKLGI